MNLLSKKRIVIKVGTSTITTEEGRIDIRALDNLAKVLSGIQNSGYSVVLVSSGAIAVGANKMKLKEKPKELRMKQAAAAVGQCELMHIYDKLFSEYGEMVAQILFSADDMNNSKKKKNLANTFDALIENGIIPIINENDSISYQEIESEKKLFGDNDTLSAVVAVFCNAAKLVILSDIEGLYDSDPGKNPDAKLISRVEVINDEIRNLASGAGSSRGTGGMITKLDAAELATSRGIDVLITYGRNPGNLYDIIDKKIVGTLFVAKEDED